jgi:putative transposase
MDNLVSRGLDPTTPRLFIVDGAKALSKAIRRKGASENAATVQALLGRAKRR